jgi:hypothetical protein
LPLDYKAFYDAEMAQRDQLRGAVGTPIGLLTLLGALLGTMAQKYVITNDWVTIAFTTFFGTASYCILRGAYYLMRSYHGHVYKRMPTALELRQYRDQLISWHRQQASDEPTAEREFEDYLTDQYAKAADRNAYVNLEKSSYLFATNRAIIYAGITTALTLLAFVGNQLTAEKETLVQAVDVIPRLDMEHLRDERARQQESKASSASSASTKADTTATKGPKRRPDHQGP